MRQIAYTYGCFDLFHFGHLQLFKKAKQKCNFHVCGLLTDHISQKWLGDIITNYEERKMGKPKIFQWSAQSQ